MLKGIQQVILQIGLVVCLLIRVLIPSAHSSVSKLFAVDSNLGGVESPYTSVILKIINNWKFIKPAALNSGNPVHLECYVTPNNKYYIGVKQTQVIQAPLARVEAILDDMGHYQDLFPDFKDIHVVSRQANRIVTFWEQKIPVFFLPNLKYESIYLVDKSNPHRKIYRYQLKEAGKIKASDGVIVIEEVEDKEAVKSGQVLRTYYTEYDFFDAEWGPLKTFGPGRIWGDSVGGIYLSDVAIKLKAENPDWSYVQIQTESKKMLEAFSTEVEKAIEHRQLMTQ